MFVIKRNAKKESVKFDKITARIEKLCYGLDRRFVNSIDVAKKVIEGLYDGVTTTELDNLAAETAASLTVKHPDYALLASRNAITTRPPRAVRIGRRRRRHGEEAGTGGPEAWVSVPALADSALVLAHGDPVAGCSARVSMRRAARGRVDRSGRPP